jgi:tetratricopeptide (TPR) repeat protein
MYARLLELQGRNALALYHLQIAAAFNPDVETYMEMAALDYAAGHWRRTAMDLQRALALKPQPSDEVTALNNLAWLLATCPDDSVRNGNEAVRDAEEACRLTGFKQPAFIGTLAAAYAEAGRFPDATATAETAVNLAKATGNVQYATIGEQMLQLYRAGKPYHQKASGQ